MRKILPWIPYLVFGYMAALIFKMYRLSSGANIWTKLFYVCSNIGSIWEHPLQGLLVEDILAGVTAACFFYLIVQYRIRHGKKFRHGMEYGSARWGTAKDIAPYMDKVFENNIILTATEGLMMSGRPKHPKYARNKNVVVIGGSGTGKSRFAVKPNLMQMHSSYVVTDPNGLICIGQRNLTLKEMRCSA